MVVTGLDESTSVWGAGGVAELAPEEGITTTDGAGLSINQSINQSTRESTGKQNQHANPLQKDLHHVKS